MDTTHFTALLRSLATTPSRRSVARALAGTALTGALIPLFGFAEAEAKGHKKQKRRRKKKLRKKQPFCAGENFCTGDPAACGITSLGFVCRCLVTAEAGAPFCAETWTLTLDCDACSPGETCVALGGSCSDGMACAIPCADPL